MNVHGLDALIPLIMIGLPLGLITLFSEMRKRTPTEKVLRGATRL